MENNRETVFSIVGEVVTAAAQVVEFYVYVVVGAILVHHLIGVGLIKLAIEPKILEAVPAYSLMVLAFGSLIRNLSVPFIQLPARLLYAIHRAVVNK